MTHVFPFIQNKNHHKQLFDNLLFTLITIHVISFMTLLSKLLFSHFEFCHRIECLSLDSMLICIDLDGTILKHLYQCQSK